MNTVRLQGPSSLLAGWRRASAALRLGAGQARRSMVGRDQDQVIFDEALQGRHRDYRFIAGVGERPHRSRVAL